METVTARLLPGEGAIDLVGNIQALDVIGNTAPIGAEVFSDALAVLSPTEAARRILRAARAGVRKDVSLRVGVPKYGWDA